MGEVNTTLPPICGNIRVSSTYARTVLKVFACVRSIKLRDPGGIWSPKVLY